MKFRAFALLFALFAGLCSLASAEEVLIKEAWVREGPPGMPMMAGFMILENNTAEDVVISSVSSPSFGSIEMHETVIENDVARMIAVEKLVVPAQGKTVLEPGGKHLMLFHPVQALKAGDEVVFWLSGNKDCMKATATVRGK